MNKSNLILCWINTHCSDCLLYYNYYCDSLTFCSQQTKLMIEWRVECINIITPITRNWEFRTSVALSIPLRKDGRASSIFPAFIMGSSSVYSTQSPSLCPISARIMGILPILDTSLINSYNLLQVLLLVYLKRVFSNQHLVRYYPKRPYIYFFIIVVPLNLLRRLIYRSTYYSTSKFILVVHRRPVVAYFSNSLRN